MKINQNDFNKVQTTINQRIKFLVDRSNLSARKFSKELGVGETTTQNYLEPGNREPGARYLERLAKRFEIMNTRWLLTGEGEAFPSGESTIIQAQEKNSGNVVGQITGGKNEFTTLADCAKENEHLRAQVALLNRHLDEKERTIQILLKQQLS